MNKRNQGIPAAAILAGGISRHGRNCDCHYCTHAPNERQAIPTVAAGVLQPPIKTRDAIGDAFAEAHAVVAQLKAERDARELVGLDRDWSPAQHVRRAA